MTKMTEIRLLRISTTINQEAKSLAGLATTHIVGKEGLSDIAISYPPPPIRRAHKNPNPKHAELDPSIPQLNFLAGIKYLAEQIEEIEDEQYEQYEPQEEIDIDE
jgi:hypothetical protein